MGYMKDSSGRRLDDFQVAGVRAPVIYDPATKPNGDIASSGFMDTGEPFTTFESPTAPAPLAISSGVISHTPHASAQSAGYFQANLGGRVTRIGCMASWTGNGLGVVALVIPSAQWSTGVLPNAGFHLTISGNGIWTLTRFTTGGSTTLASYQTHGRPKLMTGLGYVPIDVWLDPANSRCVIKWPDGTESPISHAYLGSETGNYAIWELFENNGGGADAPATLGRLWASAEPVTHDRHIPTPIQTAKATTALTSYNVSGTFNPDFTKSLVHEVTLVGNLTAVTPLNPPNSREILELHLIQDATGSRTWSGLATSLRFAGGSAPALTTTPLRRDVFRFRYMGSVYVEIGRNMNVGN